MSGDVCDVSWCDGIAVAWLYLDAEDAMIAAYCSDHAEWAVEGAYEVEPE